MTRSAISAGVFCLAFATSLAAPLLDRDGFGRGLAVESEHDSATCAARHDHRICTQLGTNYALDAAELDHRAAHVLVDIPSPAGSWRSGGTPVLEGPPSRAPPLA
jgi:hypothetical protein